MTSDTANFIMKLYNMLYHVGELISQLDSIHACLISKQLATSYYHIANLNIFKGENFYKFYRFLNNQILTLKFPSSITFVYCGFVICEIFNTKYSNP